MSRHRIRLAGLALLLALGSSVGCADRAAPESAGAAAPLATKASEAGEQDAAEAPLARRMVIRTAHVELHADRPDAVAVQAASLAEQLGGFVAQTDASGTDDAVYRVDMTLRVPADRFDDVLESLRGAGELVREAITGQDVTEEYTDIQARLRSQRALEERLLGILDTVSSVEDALAVEEQLARVRTEIERHEGRTRLLEDQVDLATVQLAISRADAPESETFAGKAASAFEDATDLSTDVVAMWIRLMGLLIPFLALGAPFALGMRWAMRRRRAARALPQKSR